MKPCPFCAESMKNEAIVCPRCGRSGNPRRRQLALKIGFAVVIGCVVFGLAALGWVVTEYQEAQDAAARRQLFGDTPAPTDAEREVLVKKQIYNAVHFTGIESAAKRYNKTPEEVRAIVAEGNKAGWPKPR